MINPIFEIIGLSAAFLTTSAFIPQVYKIYKDKKIHRDKSISFYVEDPDGNILQILWHPTLSNVS